ncbi:peptidase S51 [Veronia nyctiphanis]|uniref:Peptidase S51 n=1 Tax=Veronia nyctiphanis TaxID=1278244 RepID=A0A4Q0YMX2_9GAMM|nr:Type 1 glutamine amidotransferase-like domain-containing protein [Veronia nyctiphanis]RXJ72136.1 peptidase S51 [Veronia nyctiphanis]
MNLIYLSELQHHTLQQAISRFTRSQNISIGQGAYISSQHEPEQLYFRYTRERYTQVGLDLAYYFDLEDAFDEMKIEKVFGYSFIHLSGGDTFRFLKAIKERALLPRLLKYVESGGVVIGVSAGAMIMTSSIDSAVLCGDHNTVELSDFSGLGLGDFLIAPHADKSETECRDALKIANEHGLPIYLCSDDDAIVISGHEHIIIGCPLLVQPSLVRV